MDPRRKGPCTRWLPKGVEVVTLERVLGQVGDHVLLRPEPYRRKGQTAFRRFHFGQ